VEKLHDELKLVEEREKRHVQHHPETLDRVRVAQGRRRASQLDSSGGKVEGKEASSLVAMAWPEEAGNGQARRWRRGGDVGVARAREERKERVGSVV
jgi:hypothetical protein